MTQFATIVSALEQAITGEPAPSFLSPDFRKLVSALTAITSMGIDPQARMLNEKLGNAAISMLLDRLQASMTTERTLRIMRSDKPDAVC